MRSVRPPRHLRTTGDSPARPPGFGRPSPGHSGSEAARGPAPGPNDLSPPGTALHQSPDVRGGVPAALQDGPGVPAQSWTPDVLPYIEQTGLAGRYRLDKDWNDAATNDADGGPNQADVPV